MIDSFNFKIGIMGEDGLSSSLPQNLTKAQAIAYVNRTRYEDEIKSRLVAQISRYPSNTLERALRNLDKLVARIRQDILNGKNEEQRRSEEQPIQEDHSEGRGEEGQVQVSSDSEGSGESGFDD